MIEVPGSGDVEAAAAALSHHVLRTPVLHSDDLDDWVGRPVRVKAEGLQITGSFKVRGALNRIRTFSPGERRQGLVTVSAGNAALGAAWAAQVHDASLTVVMPSSAVVEKQAAVARLGAEVVTEGVRDSASAFARAHHICGERGATFVHPFDDPMVIAGAATATLELLQDVPGLVRVYVPASGGGLLAGAVLARDALGLDVELVAVQPAGAAALARSLAVGRPVAAPTMATVADGLTAPAPGELNIRVVASADVRVVHVSEGEIVSAMFAVVDGLRVVAEPAGAVALAGLKADVDSGAAPRCGGAVGVVLSGSNVSRRLLAEILADRAVGSDLARASHASSP